MILLKVYPGLRSYLKPVNLKARLLLSEINGICKISEVKGIRRVSVISDNGEEKVYQVPYGSRIRIKEGALCNGRGSINRRFGQSP